MTPTAYIRSRAAKLRERAAATMDPAVRDDYVSGARHLELVADELDADFHVSDEDE